MSSQLKTINGCMTSIEHLTLEMGQRLNQTAGQDLKNKLESGEIMLVNGQYVGRSLVVNRPKRTRIKPAFTVIK